jgi:hypothetical protein
MNKSDIPADMLADLNRLHIYLPFGSRSMATRPAQEGFDPAVMIGSQIDDSTDWDFTAPYSEKNHEALISSGYAYWPPEALSYKDDLTTGVYIKSYMHKFDMSNPIIYSGVPTANVVLRNDYYIFRQVWESIDPEFYYKHIWKRSPRYDFQEMRLTKEMIRDILNQMFRTARHMI